MIRRVEKRTPQFDELCARDVFGTRTAGYYRCYGADRPDVSFFAQCTDAFCTGVASVAFGNVSLTVLPQADLGEWERFMRFLGCQTLLCDSVIAREMHFSVADSGFVMRYCASDRAPQMQTVTPMHADFSYLEVYDLLCACGFSLGEFTPWLEDLALRVRRNAAKVLCVREEEQTVSTASVLFDSGSAVYLGAVATHPSKRGQGLGGDLVLQLAQCGKRAEILCKAHRVSFYESLGFCRNGEFSLCHFSE